jgi:hypothetical protein
VQSNSRIQFGSNLSKFVPRKLDPELLPTDVTVHIWRPSAILRSIRFEHTGVCLGLHSGSTKLLTVTKHVVAIISTSELCGSESLTYMGMTKITNNTTIWFVIIRTTLIRTKFNTAQAIMQLPALQIV